jgi:MYXO-CTERM domain-containing protein
VESELKYWEEETGMNLERTKVCIIASVGLIVLGLSSLARAQVSLPYVEGFEGTSGETYLLSTNDVIGAPDMSYISGGEAVGPLDNTIGSGDVLAAVYPGLLFDVAQAVIIDGVYVYPAGAGDVVINVFDSTSTLVATTTVTVAGTGRTYIPLHFVVPAGTDYSMTASGSTTGGFFRNSGGVSFPYANGDVTITAGTPNGSYYYYFYDWQVHPIHDSYFVQVGPVDNTFGTGSYSSNMSLGLNFNVTEYAAIQGVYVYHGGPGNVVVNVRLGGTLVNTVTVAVTGTGRSYIPLNFILPPATGYRMDAVGTTTGGLFRNSAGVSYPYVNGNVSIFGASNGNPTLYYYFYDWQVSEVEGGRLRMSSYTHSGSYAATLDKWPVDGVRASNYLTLTLDMTNYVAATDSVELKFWANRHGDNSDLDDRVWIRGSVMEPWTEVVDLPTETTVAGVYTEISVDLSAELGAVGQDFGATFGVRFGQKDSWDANTMANADGYSFDDIEIHLVDVCGNGTVEGTEACDDGNTSNLDGCLNSCVVATCGDGYVWGGTEECDDSNASNTDGCLNSCVVATCGDGYVLAGTEACDDGNADNTDGCLDTCLAATCGDGYVWDGTEECDDSNADNTDDCLDTCVAASCGDGNVWAGTEECDDSNTTDNDGCDDVCDQEHGFDCTGDPSICVSVCGDGVVASDEGCDDNGIVAGDGCDASCIEETGYDCTGEPSVCVETGGTCGDGMVDTGETCDDGNTAAADGCDASCAVETGWTCTGEPSVCVEIGGPCGDGVVDAGETCDDGNTADDDGCDASCAVETGWTCTGEPSVCAEIGSTCGDGVVDAGETCDDGNTAAGDGCDASCAVETGWLCTDSPSDCCGDADDDGVCDAPIGTGDSGCGCATGNTRDHSVPVMFLLIGMLLFWRRR